MSTFARTVLSVALGALLLGGVAPAPAQASTAAAVSASLNFSGSGTSLRMVTSVKFTATYTRSEEHTS